MEKFVSVLVSKKGFETFKPFLSSHFNKTLYREAGSSNFLLILKISILQNAKNAKTSEIMCFCISYCIGFD